MKTIALTTVCLLMICSKLFAQQINLVGTWQVDLSKTIELMNNSVKDQFNSLQEDAKVRLSGSMEGREFQFKANGDFQALWKLNDVEKISIGTWSLQGQRLKIILNNQQIEYDVLINKFGDLTLHGVTKGGLFDNLYLVKK